jgi:hypothetical protein
VRGLILTRLEVRVLLTPRYVKFILGFKGKEERENMKKGKRVSKAI